MRTRLPGMTRQKICQALSRSPPASPGHRSLRALDGVPGIRIASKSDGVTNRGVFERSAGLEIGGDAGRAEHVAAELDPEAGVGRAPAHHAVGVDAVHRLVGEHGRGGLAVLADAGRGEILIEELFELVMRRHFVALAAFLVKAHHQRLPPG